MTWSQSNVSRIDGPILEQSCESQCMIFYIILAIVLSEYSGWAPWTVACQAPLSMEFSRQEYWSGLPFPSPWDLPNPGIKARSSTLQANSLVSEPLGKSSSWAGSTSQAVPSEEKAVKLMWTWSMSKKRNIVGLRDWIGQKVCSHFP